MKFVFALGSIALLPACSSTRTVREAAPVRFEIVESFDAPEDEITIEQVFADNDALEAGTTLRVRGRYRLASVDNAQLYVGVTNGAGSMALVDVTAGERSFELTLHATRAGNLHVSLYAGPIVNGSNCIGKRRFELRAD